MEAEKIERKHVQPEADDQSGIHRRAEIEEEQGEYQDYDRQVYLAEYRRQRENERKLDDCYAR